MSRSKKIIAALYLLAFVACDDGPSEPESGQYDIAVTGAVTEVLRGRAWFGADTDENGSPIFGVVLGDGSEHMVVLGKEGRQAPAAGQYAVRAPGTNGTGWEAVYIIGGEGDELVGLFVADSGRVVISESKTGRLRGSVKLYASGLLGEGEPTIAQVVLEGTFDARPATAPVATSPSRSSAGRGAPIR